MPRWHRPCKSAVVRSENKNQGVVGVGMMGGMKRESAAGFRWAVLGVLMVMTAASAWAGSQDNPRLSLPHSHLGLDPDSPAFLVGYVGTGGAFSNSNGQFGYGGAVVFHPDYAANFLDFLRQWNAGLVLQVDYQELYTHYRIRSGDFILRKYLGDYSPLEAMEFLKDKMRFTATNEEFLISMNS